MKNKKHSQGSIRKKIFVRDLISESVLNALLRAKVIDFPEEVTTLASGLNGGVGSAGYTCGALASCMIALGAVYGRRDPIANRDKIFHDVVTSHKVENPEEDYRYYFMRRFNQCVQKFWDTAGTWRCQDVVDGNGGYYSPDRQAQCEKMIHLDTELALKYIDMEQEDANKLSFGDNLFGWE